MPNQEPERATGDAINECFSQQPSADGLKMLEALREAVAKTLERKRRLGQYAVFWDGNKVVMIGDDAPKAEG